MDVVILAIGFDQSRLKVLADTGKEACSVSCAASDKTFRRYLVTKTKWTCNAKTQCLPVRKSFVFAIDQLYNMSMQIRKGYKYRLKTNRATRAKFVRFAGACRFVWNKVLSINEHRYFAGVPCLSYAEACQLLAWWKQSEEYGWLHAVHSQVLQQCLKDLERAYANLFAGRAAPPQYRKKFLADSFRYPQGVKVDGRLVYLPLIGWVEFWASRPIEGTIKNVTVSRQGQHWFVALQVELDVPAPVHPSMAEVGIDLGIATFAATSAGKLHPPLNAYRRIEGRKPVCNGVWRAWSNTPATGKSSNGALPNSISALPIVATIFCTNSVTDQQKPRGYCAGGLAGPQYVAVGEGHGGGAGEERRTKAGLNKAILDQGWGMFRHMLEYKQPGVGAK